MINTPASALQWGAVVTGMGGGLALFLYGMRKMTESLKIAAGGMMKNMLGRLTANRFSGALAGALVTAVVQSSSATTGVIIVLAGQGFVSLETGIALVFGASIGTCVTALAAAIGRPRDALRAAVDKNRIDAYRLVSKLLTAMERSHALCRRIAAAAVGERDEITSPTADRSDI